MLAKPASVFVELRTSTQQLLGRGPTLNFNPFDNWSQQWLANMTMPI
ncbi:MAG: hypothetical protein AAFP82_18575 [Bacteroidota bacterium]